jgi:hypothetical protein
MTVFLAVFIIGTAWVASLYVKPFGRCWRCWGHGNIRKGRRRPKCPVCHGLRRRQRAGSRTVHRVRRQVTGHWRQPKDGTR